MQREAFLFETDPLCPPWGLLDGVNGLVCSAGDQTWHLNVDVHNDKARGKPETLGDEMDRELVKWAPILCHLCEMKLLATARNRAALGIQISSTHFTIGGSCWEPWVNTHALSK